MQVKQKCESAGCYMRLFAGSGVRGLALQRRPRGLERLKQLPVEVFDAYEDAVIATDQRDSALA